MVESQYKYKKPNKQKNASSMRQTHDNNNFWSIS